MKTLINQFDSYKQAINFLNDSHIQTIDLTLDRIKKFLNIAGNPQTNLQCIHIAGTNGKGSVLKFIETILIEAGYNVGSFTSPHLIDYTERIAINGIPVSHDTFLLYFNKVYKLLNRYKDVHLTLFEYMTAMAFMYFAEMDVDFVLLEVGLGGQFDSTNVIEKPLLSIITEIDLDHQAYLGNTIEKIAFEKAGIMKKLCPVLISAGNKASETLKTIAREKNSVLLSVDPSAYELKPDIASFKQRLYSNHGTQIADLSMIGEHQLSNAILAIKAIEYLGTQGYNIPSNTIEAGLSKTIWPGRAQYIEEKHTLLDGAHNPCGARVLRKVVDTYFSGQSIIWVIGILNTKDYKTMLETLIKPEDTVIFTEPVSSGATPVQTLLEHCSSISCKEIYTYKVISEAYKKACKLSQNKLLIVISGSLYLVGEFLKKYQ